MIYYNKSYVNAHNSLSKYLTYKFNTFFIFPKYLSHTVATTFAI